VVKDGSGADREARAVWVRSGDDVEPASSDGDAEQDADEKGEPLPVIQLD